MTVSDATKELPLLRILWVQKKHLPWEACIKVSPEVSDILSVDFRPGKLRMQRNRDFLFFECGVQAALDMVRDGGVRVSEVENLRLSGYIEDIASKVTYGSVPKAPCGTVLYVSYGAAAKASYGARKNSDDNNGETESDLYEGMVRLGIPAFAYDRLGYTLFLSCEASIVIWKVKKEPIRVIVDGSQRVSKEPTWVIVDGSRRLEKESGQQAKEGPTSAATCFSTGEQGKGERATHEIIVSELVDKAGGDWRKARFGICATRKEAIGRQEFSIPRVLADVILWEASVERIIQGEIPIAPAPHVINHRVLPLEIEARRARGGVLVAIDISQEIYYSLPDGLLRSARKNERFTCFAPYSQGRLAEFEADIERDAPMRSVWVYPDISVVSREYECSSGIFHVALLVRLDIAVTGRREIMLLREGSPGDRSCMPRPLNQWFRGLMRRIFPWTASNGKAPKRLHGNRIDHDIEAIPK